MKEAKLPEFLEGKSLPEMEKIADFYQSELADLIDNPKIIDRFLLKHDYVSEKDFKMMSQVGRVILNYNKLQRLKKEL